MRVRAGLGGLQRRQLCCLQTKQVVWSLNRLRFPSFQNKLESAVTLAAIVLLVAHTMNSVRFVIAGEPGNCAELCLVLSSADGRK